MDQDLTRYLNDHLAGSSGALMLIQDIEFWRIQAAREILADADRRAGIELK